MTQFLVQPLFLNLLKVGGEGGKKTCPRCVFDGKSKARTTNTGPAVAVLTGFSSSLPVSEARGPRPSVLRVLVFLVGGSANVLSLLVQTEHLQMLDKTKQSLREQSPKETSGQE